MWLRMVNHQSKSSIDTLPNFTGKSWNEWLVLLDSDPKSKCGISPLIDYLTTHYNLTEECAQTIAFEYVFGNRHHDA